MSSSVASFFSSLFPTAYADAPEEKEEEQPKEQEEEESKDEGEGEEGGEAEEEEEEPVDPAEALREECQNSSKCASLTKHFQHCQEKVSSGQGFKGEDCVEELFHMMHCVDNCVAPKLFSKLK